MRRTIDSLVLLAAAAVAVTTAAFAGKPQPPQPPPPLVASDIVYGSATASTGGDLTLMQRDGSGKSVLLVAASELAAPDWSPDGKYVVCLDFTRVRVVEAATGKSCLLTGSFSSTAPTLAPKFHPLFSDGIGDGRYVVAYSNYSATHGYQLWIVSFRFAEGTCEVINEEGMTTPPEPPGRQLTFTSDVNYDGAVWSPDGTQLASRVTDPDTSNARLRIHNVVTDGTGRLVLSGQYVEYHLDQAVAHWFGYTRNLQWDPNDPNRLALIGKWVSGGNGSKEIFEINISSNPPSMAQITDSTVDEIYFDYLPDGFTMVVGRTDGIFLVPGNGIPIAAPEKSGKKFVKWPHSPAWNPTRY